MNKTNYITLFVPSLLGLLLTAGCGGGDDLELGTVSGTITLAGKPLADARIEFQPEGSGSPSYGNTDEDGRYELLYSVGKPGAMIGKHLVRISTFRQEPGQGGPPKTIPERVPDKDNAKSELVREVQSGDQELNFEL